MTHFKVNQVIIVKIVKFSCIRERRILGKGGGYKGKELIFCKTMNFDKFVNNRVWKSSPQLNKPLCETCKKNISCRQEF